jgi:hypothetical protein
MLHHDQIQSVAASTAPKKEKLLERPSRREKRLPVSARR